MTLAPDNRPILVNQVILKKLSTKEIKSLAYHLAPLVNTFLKSNNLFSEKNKLKKIYSTEKSQIFLIDGGIKQFILKRNTHELGFLKDLFFLYFFSNNKLAPKIFGHVEKEQLIFMEYLPKRLRCIFSELKQAFHLLGRAHATFKKKHDLIPASHTNKLTLDFLHEAQAIYEKANGKFPWAGFGDIKKSHFYFSKDRTLKLLDFETVSTELPQVFDLISMFNLLPSSVLWNKNKWLILCYSYHCGLNFKNTRYSFREESYKQIFELGEKLSTSLKKEHPL